MLVVVVLLAAGVRVVGLDRPAHFVFDERYYVPPACRAAFGDEPACSTPSPYDAHPPLGKWLIATGIRALGLHPVGWRMAAAVVGSATVGVLYVAARRLLGSTLAAAVAAGLLAIDFLHIVHSRLAMLDVFLTFFVVFAFLAYVLDREQTRALREASGSRRPRLRPWQVFAGVAAGAAMAVKWSGALILGAVAILSMLDASTTGSHPRQRRGRLACAGLALRTTTPLAAIAAAVYLAAHLTATPGTLLTWPWEPGARLRTALAVELQRVRTQTALPFGYLGETGPWTWPSGLPPILYSVERVDRTVFAAILALGNPAAWWPAILVLAAMFVRFWRNAEWPSPDLVILVAFLANYLPWWLIYLVRPVYLFHFLPAVPFLYLAVARTGGLMAASSRGGRVALGTYLAVTGLVFCLAAPVVIGMPVSLTPLYHPPANYLFVRLPNCSAVQLVPAPADAQPEPC
ncbi:MAG: phospholipid carrier-dependent glycosyltransferase [Firmicutes bacterium]|nr:phospholipid carrier-dependent glycosyltransferase [Bacillota bacterium]